MIKEATGIGSFVGSKFKDSRLLDRLGRIMSKIGQRDVSQSLPSIFQTKSELAGFYRFVNHERVEFSDLIKAQREQTAQTAPADKDLLAIHDTTAFTFGKEASIEGLGYLTPSSKGFFGHFCLGVQLNRRVAGVLGLKPWMRSSKKREYQSPSKRRIDPTRESQRWPELLHEVHQNYPNPKRLIHVADREADEYSLLSGLLDQGIRFVIRAKYNRRIHGSTCSLLFDSLKQATVICERQVPISARKGSVLPSTLKSHPPRKKRIAKLGVATRTEEVLRSNTSDTCLPKTLKLNFVRVFELDPPVGVEAIEWTLMTSEPIETPEELLRIVDIYCARWTIEEFFKALKTGCAFEKRGLESLSALLNCLALFVPIACKLYNLKMLAKEDPEKRSEDLITPIQTKILASWSKLHEDQLKTATQVMNAVASIGGHLKHNGPPGWQVLARGYEQLLSWEQGWILSQNHLNPTCPPQHV